VPLDLDLIGWLQSSDGVAATESARTALARGDSTLTVVERLRRTHSPLHAQATLTLIEGRRSASAKFHDAEHLYFDRESAEQATSEHVAAHTASRFDGVTRIADLGCGGGADTLALAAHAPVLAIDRAPERLALVRANAAVRGLAGRVETLAADIMDVTLPADIDALWLDPARRDEFGRNLDPERWSPPLSHALALATRYPRAGIKVAPGIDHAHIPSGAEVEFISLEGRLVEAVIWLGAAVTSPRRATSLPSGASLEGAPDSEGTPIAPPTTYLYDLDPAVGRAGLVDVLAPTLDAHLIEEQVAYLSGDTAHDTPFARRFRILDWAPFSERRLLETVRTQHATRVEVMRRASPVDTNALERRLNRALTSPSGDKQQGDRVITVALTRHAGEHIAITCERER